MLPFSSGVVPTGPENRPVSITGCWAIKLFGAVQNVGSVDAEGLATQVAGLQGSKLDISNIVGPIGGGSVIESGSNANGNWVKYADGTMICTAVIELTVKPISSPFGASGVWAASFIASPSHVSHTVTGTNSGSLQAIGQLNINGFRDGSTSTIASITGYTYNSSIDTSVHLSSKALGRWK